jgi:hypothetical protein
VGTGKTGRLRPAQSSCFVLAFQPLGAEMARKQRGYVVTVAGPGHNFERPSDETIASQILALTMTGTATPASWLSSRGDDPLAATAVSKALSDHHQKKLANPADCLNRNVSKGHCEKRKDGSFFITPEGLEALEGAAPE